ncbi:hypothetical protein VV01_13420 [Luteipulveratus halotolerans]|uniref:Uncharacterized protein n=1 Tax=Luteipulveratus halotolerans TaxID=1631356 RepID=A0A0L6CJY2_9MICO|nr:hypothetical protein VV01_13420 [Luteipulveratus halotolerans]
MSLLAVEPDGVADEPSVAPLCDGAGVLLPDEVVPAEDDPSDCSWPGAVPLAPGRAAVEVGLCDDVLLGAVVEEDVPDCVRGDASAAPSADSGACCGVNPLIGGSVGSFQRLLDGLGVVVPDGAVVDGVGNGGGVVVVDGAVVVPLGRVVDGVLDDVDESWALVLELVLRVDALDGRDGGAGVSCGTGCGCARRSDVVSRAEVCGRVGGREAAPVPDVAECVPVAEKDGTVVLAALSSPETWVCSSELEESRAPPGPGVAEVVPPKMPPIVPSWCSTGTWAPVTAAATDDRDRPANATPAAAPVCSRRRRSRAL